MTARVDINALGQAGMSALNSGDAQTARSNFEAIIAAGAGDPATYLALAMACRGMGDHSACINACDQVLAKESANVRALVLKGDSLWDGGDRRGASTFYALVGKLVPDTRALPPAAALEVERVAKALAEYMRDLDVHLRASMGTMPAPSHRFSESLDLLSGTATRYFQQPRSYYFPQLPCIDFYDTAQFSWASGLEAEISAIVSEAKSVLATPAATEFQPYIHAIDNKPLDPDHPLLDNMDWSALFLVQNGQQTPAANRFPAAMAALAKTPLERVAGRGPSILISRLAPGAHIQPHHGFLNTRLTCHIPLVLPGNCGIRVGNTTREWEAGKLLAFNDSIEHEAWNNSRSDRYVLIFQTWRPELTRAECEAVSQLLQGVDSYPG